MARYVGTRSCRMGSADFAGSALAISAIALGAAISDSQLCSLPLNARAIARKHLSEPSETLFLYALDKHLTSKFTPFSQGLGLTDGSIRR